MGKIQTHLVLAEHLVLDLKTELLGGLRSDELKLFEEAPLRLCDLGHESDLLLVLRLNC